MARFSFVFRRRTVVLLALLAVAALASVVTGHPQPYGMWDGPL